jgi:dTDP-glucose 4,6-dehydratase
MSKSILITGGAGFIGSHVVKLFVTSYPQYRIVNLDALTYAGNLENLVEVEDASNYFFEKADIQDEQILEAIFEKHAITDVIWQLNPMWIDPYPTPWHLYEPMFLEL